MFEAGFTTETNGTGGGLTILNSIAEAQGWPVTVTDSAVERTATGADRGTGSSADRGEAGDTRDGARVVCRPGNETAVDAT